MNHKFSFRPLCVLAFLVLLLSFTSKMQAQSSAGLILLQEQANQITAIAIARTADANYIANHASGNGNAAQMNQRMARLGSGLQSIQTRVAILFDIALQTSASGLKAEAEMIMSGYSAAQISYNAIINQVSAGLPMPQQAAQDLQSQLFALRDASPCIRREIQELDE
jgi:hypothetical protein